MKFNLDETDKQILNALYVSSEKSQKRIASSLGISEPNLSKRISAMRDSGVLNRFTVDINYDALGFDTNSVTFIKLSDQHKNKVDEVISELRSINEAIEIYTIFGDSDIYVRWVTASNARTMAALSTILQKPEIANVETVTLAEAHKRERGPTIS